MTDKTFKPFVVGEVVKTRGGRPARIICTDRISGLGKPILALVKLPGMVEETVAYYADGKCYTTQSGFDLIREPVVTRRFRNVYASGEFGNDCSTREAADIVASGGPRSGVLETVCHDGYVHDVIYHRIETT